MRTLRIGRKHLAISAILVAATAGWTSYSIGQQARPTAPPRNNAARQEKPDQFDHNVAQCLILSNQNEVAAAQIAEKKATSKEVKSFAATMVKDHDQFTADLEKFAGHNYRHRDGDGRAATSETPRAAPANGATRAAAAPPARAAAPQTTAPRTRDGDQADHADHTAKYMQIREEIADQCRASVQRELDSKQGHAFDECYMGLQIGAHMKMIDELTVLSRHVSPEFKPILTKGLQTAQSHFDKAKQVMKDINDGQTASAKDASAK